MSKIVNFNPTNTNFKSPVGAVKMGETTRFNIFFNRPTNPEEVYLVLTKDGEDDVRYKMQQVTLHSNDNYEYTISIQVTSFGLYFYHFDIDTRDKTVRIGSDDNLDAMYGKGANWQLTVYDSSIVAPTWLKGGVIYQILPDRFNVGEPRNKTKGRSVIYRDDINGIPEYEPVNGKILNNDFFGGNLNGITKKLGYIKSLGVNCIYLNPIFEAYSNHKYDTGNYLKIDPDFGTIDDLKKLIKRANTKDIKIVLDGVFSHTGDDSIYFNKYNTYDSVGAFQSDKSAYRSWYNFDSDNNYASWWGIDTLPNTNETDAGFIEFICGPEGVARTWTRLGLGGWRLDVVDEIPDPFLDRLKSAIKKENKDAVIFGEVWEDASNKVAYSQRRRYLTSGQVDSVTNYPFYSDILHFIRCGDEKRLGNTVNYLINNYPKHALDNLMNLLGTHDTARLITVLGNCNTSINTRQDRAVAKVSDIENAIVRLKMATVLQYTLPGVPCVYYGDEAGLEGYEDPFNRRCHPFNNGNKKILSWYRKLAKLRINEKNILSEGVYQPLTIADGVFAFKRVNNIEELTIIVNNSGKSVSFNPDGTYTDIISGKEYNGTVKDKQSVILKK